MNFHQVLCRCCSVAQFHVTLCDPMDCSMPGFPVLHYLPEFVQTHVHWVSDAIPTISSSVAPCPLVLLPSIFSTIRVFSNESALCIRGLNIGATASASILPMNIQDWFPLGLTVLISFRIDWFELLAVPMDSQESSPAPQFKSINSLVLSLPYGSTFTSINDY